MNKKTLERKVACLILVLHTAIFQDAVGQDFCQKFLEQASAFVGVAGAIMSNLGNHTQYDQAHVVDG
jgi:hypothetical protein